MNFARQECDVPADELEERLAVLKELEAALMRFQGERVVHEAWVMMPNHVHLLFRPMMKLEDLIKAWKGVSARRIGKGPIWQQNYRDTLIRGPRHFAGAVKYIRMNPRMAGLRAGEYS